ncbi:SCO7613 C-terminal domain-containing membrane protein [Paractinoplanes rishiriensis]|uniref:SCO7613 C-terminal domain-containing membrane protein n=1 Tax=Paractinoplanes rishiriensis TaxID=1050105 RepID=UPI0019439949|nr:hypothetical protein [Actinoplanes rishiriensis]
MTYPCAYCGAPASAETGCPACGHGPDPDAIDVVRTDAEISELIAHLAAARHQVRDLEDRIGQAWQRRHAAASRVRAAVSATRPAPVAVAAPRTETSTRVVQNVLFLLGGLLLGVAAIVFTAVAWAQFGLAGRAALLAGFTLAALAVPVLALRRGLRATAETMAAVGLLLFLLDGYAAWHVNLFGVAGGEPARYAGLVCAATAVVAAGYARLTGLVAPRWAALLTAQPALPLIVAPAEPGPAGWTLTFGALAASNLAVLSLRNAITPTRAAATSAAATAAARNPGITAGAATFGAIASLIAFAPAFGAAIATLETATPAFHAAWQAVVPGPGWQLPAALALITAAIAAVLPARWRAGAALGGAAAVALALPAGLGLAWWNASVFDLAVVAAALAMATRHATPVVRKAAPALAAPAHRVAAMPGAASPSAASSLASLGGQAASLGGQAISLVAQVTTAALLGLHALAAGFGRPGVAAAVLAVLALFGVAVAVAAKLPILRAAGQVIAVLVTPGIAWTATAALGLPGTAQARTVAAAAVLLAVVLRFIPGLPARMATVLVVLPLPLWAATAGDPVALYAALTLLLLSVAGLKGWETPIYALPAAILLVTLGPDLARLLFPLDPVWAGRPLTTPTAAVADAVAALLTAVAVTRGRWTALSAFALATPLVLAAASVPWPVLPFVTLALGLAILLAAALRPVPVATTLPAGVLLVAAGLVGALPTHASTLAALGAVLIAAAVAAVAGRTAAARLAAWPVAVAAGIGIAVTAGNALELPLRTVAFLVLGVAGTAFGLARGDHRREAAAHAAAVVALLLTVGSAGYAAAVCTIWGLVLGTHAKRRGYLLAAATAELGGWVLLMVAAEVTTLEAYTIPASAVALLAGLRARRGRVSSWVAYGPALAAALLPSLASILVADGQYLRRLLLGLAALAVLLAGARSKLRAPVEVGGVVLAAVALRELAAVWDLIPRWIPLAAGGVLLVVLATTLERRRRDLARFKQALGRMS